MSITKPVSKAFGVGDTTGDYSEISLASTEERSPLDHALEVSGSLGDVVPQPQHQRNRPRDVASGFAVTTPQSLTKVKKEEDGKDLTSQGSTTSKRVGFHNDRSVVEHGDDSLVVASEGGVIEAVEPSWQHMRRGSTEPTTDRPLLDNIPNSILMKPSRTYNQPKKSRSLTTSDAATQVLIPTDSDGQMEMMRNIMEETEDELEELQQVVKTLTRERDQFKGKWEAAAQALQQTARNDKIYEERSRSQHARILQLQKELKTERKHREENAGLEKLMDRVTAMESNITEKLSTQIQESQKSVSQALMAALPVLKDEPITAIDRRSRAGGLSPQPAIGPPTTKAKSALSLKQQPTATPLTKVQSQTVSSSISQVPLAAATLVSPQFQKDSRHQDPNSSASAPSANVRGLIQQVAEMTQNLSSEIGSLRQDRMNDQQETLYMLRLLRKEFRVQTQASLLNSSTNQSPKPPLSWNGSSEFSPRSIIQPPISEQSVTNLLPAPATDDDDSSSSDDEDCSSSLGGVPIRISSGNMDAPQARPRASSK